MHDGNLTLPFARLPVELTAAVLPFVVDHLLTRRLSAIAAKPLRSSYGAVLRSAVHSRMSVIGCSKQSSK